MKRIRLTFLGVAMALGIHVNAQCPCDLTTNLVTNPDFSAGNVGFTSSLPFDMTCNDETYGVGAEPRDKCGNTLWIDDLWDHTVGTSAGSFMIVDGWNSGTNMVWTHSNVINVTNGLQYTFSFWNVRGISGNSTEDFEVRINGTPIGTHNTAAAGQTTWTQYCLTWTATFTGPVTVSLWQTGFTSWNDYGLDDFYFGTCQAEEPCGFKEIDILYGMGTNCDIHFNASVTPNTGTTIIGYEWTFGDGHSSTEQSPVHYYLSPGTYLVCLTVYAIDAHGECCQKTICKKISVDCHLEDCKAEIKEILLSSPVCEDPCTFILDAIVSYVNRPVVGYFWDFGDATTATTTTPTVTHTFPGSGTYNVCVTIVLQSTADECCAFTYCFEVPIHCERGANRSAGDTEPMGTKDILNDTKSSPLGLFPNPGQDQLNLILNSDVNQSATVTIINTEGRQVGVEKINVGGGSVSTLNVSGLPSGIYLIRVQAGDRQFDQRWIKE